MERVFKTCLQFAYLIVTSDIAGQDGFVFLNGTVVKAATTRRKTTQERCPALKEKTRKSVARATIRLVLTFGDPNLIPILRHVQCALKINERIGPTVASVRTRGGTLVNVDDGLSVRE